MSEVAERLNCTGQHVIDLIDQGELQALDIGGSGRKFYRIPREAYDEFLRSRHSFNLEQARTTRHNGRHSR